jgi:hypothetical protein
MTKTKGCQRTREEFLSSTISRIAILIGVQVHFEQNFIALRLLRLAGIEVVSALDTLTLVAQAALVPREVREEAEFAKNQV